MKKIFLLLLLILLAMTLSACHPNLVTPTGNLIPDDFSLPAMDPEVKESLRIYPLLEGSIWVYDYLGFDQSQEAIWRVVETVIETEVIGNVYMATLERTAELVDGVPHGNLLIEPETGVFRYVIDGENIYRIDGSDDIDLSRAWLELVLPFPGEDEGWYPDPELRSINREGEMGLRQASASYQEVLPQGGVFTCYNVKTVHPDVMVDEGTFCETVGFVYQEFIYFDFSFGFRSELERFTVQ